MADYTEAKYLARAEEVAYTSEITAVIVEPRTTDLDVRYRLPPQEYKGRLLIWRGVTPDLSSDPILDMDLDPNQERVKVETTATNFVKGAYFVAITVGNELTTMAATVVLFNGQPMNQSGSFIFPTAKVSNYVSTVYGNPINNTGRTNSDWAIIYEGTELQQGELVAYSQAQLDESSGVINVRFEPGSLESGKYYNVCLSIGPHEKTISAAYVFKYLLV